MAAYRKVVAEVKRNLPRDRAADILQLKRQAAPVVGSQRPLKFPSQDEVGP